MREEINSVAQIALDTVSAEALRIHFFTGRGENHGRGRDKVIAYRTGVQTNLGDIEISVWIDAAKAVIHRDGLDDKLIQLAETQGMSALLSDSRWLTGRGKIKMYSFADMLQTVLRGG
ncbi:hypothetical protein SDC9_83277 [bioreactor metagenome]|uniref:Uncharacterized protein n=1 Tax=bioreactor metagenome TaxID=1076179 RepID=A0A644Z7R9_9ZZZZ